MSDTRQPAPSSPGMTCSNCLFYDAQDMTNNVRGTCHRNPPLGVLKGTDTFFGWPNVDPTDWCGSHRVNEYPYNTPFEGGTQ